MIIDYNTFLATVQLQHLQLLAVFSAGTRVMVLESNTQEIEETKQRCLDLYNAELLTRVAEGYERIDGETQHTFDGYVTEVAKGYVWQLARERIVLSRDPLLPDPPET